VRNGAVLPRDLLRAPFAAVLATLLTCVLQLPAAATTTPNPTPDRTINNAGALYTLDEYGGVHPVGSAAYLAGAPSFGSDLARGLALFSGSRGGYVLDAYGGLHPVGDAAAVIPGAYWPHWDIARGLALLPTATASAPAGYVLDGFGGLHAFGGAPAVTPGGYWPSWDIARAIAILPGSSASAPAGYVMDGFGGLHPFGGAPAVAPGGYWPGWDIARGIAFLPQASISAPSGYELDGFGGVHPFGGAPAAGTAAYWPAWDIAKGIVTWTAAPAGTVGGWTLDGYGGVHPFGSAPALVPTAYWAGRNIARGLASAASGGSSGRLVPLQPILHRKIEVSLSKQHLWAFNPDGSIFLDTPVTTGMAQLPTDQGDFHIFSKSSPYEFISPWPPWSPFWYPDAWVSWAMEFVGDGTYLHDAPWEPSWAFGPGSEYGAYASHGCVHIPNAAMQALYGWAKLGDEVWVHP
jgi:L,D-transpeptidase-like protein